VCVSNSDVPVSDIVLTVRKSEPVSMGVSLYCATSPTAGDANGGFFIPWARQGKPNKVVEDLQLGEKLWTWLEEETKKY
jgi:retinol dehydrogenase 12